MHIMMFPFATLGGVDLYPYCSSRISNTPLKLNSLELDYELRHDNSALTNADLTDDDNGLVSKSARLVLVDS